MSSRPRSPLLDARPSNMEPARVPLAEIPHQAQQPAMSSSDQALSEMKRKKRKKREPPPPPKPKTNLARLPAETLKQEHNLDSESISRVWNYKPIISSPLADRPDHIFPANLVDIVRERTAYSHRVVAVKPRASSSDLADLNLEQGAEAAVDEVLNQNGLVVERMDTLQSIQDAPGKHTRSRSDVNPNDHSHAGQDNVARFKEHYISLTRMIDTRKPPRDSWPRLKRSRYAMRSSSRPQLDGGGEDGDDYVGKSVKKIAHHDVKSTDAQISNATDALFLTFTFFEEILPDEITSALIKIEEARKQEKGSGGLWDYAFDAFARFIQEWRRFPGLPSLMADFVGGDGSLGGVAVEMSEWMEDEYGKLFCFTAPVVSGDWKDDSALEVFANWPTFHWVVASFIVELSLFLEAENSPDPNNGEEGSVFPPEKFFAWAEFQLVDKLSGDF